MYKLADINLIQNFIKTYNILHEIGKRYYNKTLGKLKLSEEIQQVVYSNL